MFDWDEFNVEHISLHGINVEEAEDALLDPGRIGVSATNVRAERRWAMLGATASGRVLFIVFTRRKGILRVVTARDATVREKRRYRTKGK